MVRFHAFLLASLNALPVDERWSAQLFIVKSSACRLIVRKVRLAESNAEIVVLIRTVENGPDVAIEPRPIIRIPLQPASTPVNQRSFVSWRDMLGIIERSGGAVEV